MPGRKKATEKEGKSLKTWVAKMRMPHDTGPQVAMKDSIYLYLYIYISIKLVIWGMVYGSQWIPTYAKLE